MDYSSMKAQKTKTKYHYDADISVSRNEKKKLKKAAKKLNWILALVFLVIGFAGSFCLVSLVLLVTNLLWLQEQTIRLICILENLSSIKLMKSLVLRL